MSAGAGQDPGPAGQRPERTRFGVPDELTCYYDRPAEPANVHLEVRVPVRLDRDAFRASVLAVLIAQPRARVRRSAAGRWRRSSHWEYPPVPDTDPVRVASWVDEGELSGQRAAFLSESPSLDTSPPLRFLLTSGPDCDRVILNAHHAALDGLSCLALLHAVARQYGGQAGQEAVPGRPSGTDRAVGRPVRVQASAGLDSHRAVPAGSADELAPARDRRRPGLIVRIAPQPAAAGRGPRPGYGAYLLTWSELPAVADRLRCLGASVNDLLITVMMITISRWNGRSGARPGRIRITMPVGDQTMRSADGAWGNWSRLAAVAAQVPAGTGVGALIGDVARQTRHAKERTGGPQVDLAARVLAAVPVPGVVKQGMLRAALRTAGPLFCDTSLVSNLGVIDQVRFGSVAATGVWFSTSAHMPRGLSLGAAGLDGELQLCFRYRHALLGAAAAAQFAGLFVELLDDFGSREPLR